MTDAEAWVVLIGMAFAAILAANHFISEARWKRRRRLKKANHPSQARSRDDRRKDEQERKESLRKLEPLVDEILRDLICADMALRKVLRTEDDPTSSNALSSRLKEWASAHHEVMDFPAFRHVMDELAQTSRLGFPVPASSLLQELDREFEVEEFLEFADTKLGIQRGVRIDDSWGEGRDESAYGTKYERADGSFEKVQTRIDRIVRRLPGTDRGYIYILTNQSLPGLIKIGKTHRDPRQRAAELSDHSGVPTPFDVAYQTIVGNCGLVEQLVHRRLAHHREADRRGFFAVSLDLAVQEVERAAREVGD